MLTTEEYTVLKMYADCPSDGCIRVRKDDPRVKRLVELKLIDMLSIGKYTYFIITDEGRRLLSEWNGF